MPDLNSLPPSSSPSLRSHTQTHTYTHQHPRTQHSPQAPTANTPSPRLRSSPLLNRRRSSNLSPWSLDTSSTPPSPHTTHHRAPSLGGLHQELENEQEAQVNRLLGMIRSQQAEILRLQGVSGSGPGDGAGAGVQGQQAQSQNGGAQQRPGHSRNSSQSQTLPQVGVVQQQTQPTTRSAEPSPSNVPPTSATAVPLRRSSQSQPQNHNNSITPRPPSSTSSISRQSSAASARRQQLRRNGSSFGDGRSGSPGYVTERDDVDRLKDEAFMVQRENQMLKVRIRELERMVGERGNGRPIERPGRFVTEWLRQRR